MRHTIGRRLRRVALGLLVTLFASGLGHVVLNPSPSIPSHMRAAVFAIAEGTLTADDLPADFEERMGYAPETTSEGVLIREDGGCSSPLGWGPQTFADACRHHDLGYDLLRYAQASAQPLGIWARAEIDRRFAAHLDESCDTAPCRLWTAVYGLGVTVNSIRQGYGVPVPEPTMPWIGLFAGVTLLSGGPIRPRSG